MEPIAAVQPRDATRAIATALYMAVAIGVPACLIALSILIPAVPAWRQRSDTLVLLVVPLLLVLSVMMLILFYRMWAAIQDGHARMTPGKAVGFLFIPFFNLYWAFPAIWGFAKDYNAFLERHGLSAPKLPESLYLAYCILTLCAVIPVLGAFLVVLNVAILIPILVWKTCRAINAVAGTSLGHVKEDPHDS